MNTKEKRILERQAWISGHTTEKYKDIDAYGEGYEDGVKSIKVGL